MFKLQWLLILLNIAKAVHTKQYGLALEGFSPCPNEVLYMDHLIGLPPADENYWNGTFYFDKFGTLSEVLLNVTVNAKAQLIIDPEVGGFRQSGNSFIIKSIKTPPQISSFSFVMRGFHGQGFPHVVGLVLNGRNLCADPVTWEPVLLNQTVVDVQHTVVCGVRKPANQLIFGGNYTKPGDWPWHVALYWYSATGSRTYQCGGTLLSNTIVLTAAHCVIENKNQVIPQRVVIGLGKYMLSSSSTDSQDITVHNIMIHPHYNISTLEHDIAIIRLNTEATFSENIQPICLWQDDEDIMELAENDVPGYVVGWGRYGHSDTERISDVLQFTTMPVISHIDCVAADRNFYGNYLTATSYCAGMNGSSVCNGDSGGGMFFEKRLSDDQVQFQIRGIVSLSARFRDTTNCNPDNYVVFTDVAKYLDWIRSALDG